MKQYMIIEHFDPKKIKQLYERFDNKGRILPQGVHYIDSWIDESLKTCYQLMESESLSQLNKWLSNWDDLADFEIIPLITSEVAKQRVLNKV